VNRHLFTFANFALLVVFVAIIVVPGCVTQQEQEAQSHPVTILVVDKTIQYSDGYTIYVFTDGTTVYHTNWLNWRQLQNGTAYQFMYNPQNDYWELVTVENL